MGIAMLSIGMEERETRQENYVARMGRFTAAATYRKSCASICRWLEGQMGWQTCRIKAGIVIID